MLMYSKVHSSNGTAVETELPATAAVETEQTVEAQAEPVADHSTRTDFAPATTIHEKVHSPMASKIHPGNGTAAGSPETEIPATAVEVAPEKEVKPTADRPAPAAETTVPKKEDCLFRVIVPALKAKNITGRNGNLIKKMCEETKAHIIVLEGPVWHPDRIVLISGKEEIEAPLSPAMDAVIRVFKVVNGFPENESDGLASIPFSSIRLLLTSMQATSLIGNQGSSVNTIQQNIGCSVRILPSDEVSTLSANSDDRVVDLKGEGLKVLQALEAVLKHLRMFLVDHSIPPLFIATHNATSTLEKHQVLTQVTQKIAISIRKVVDIIGIGGMNIANIGLRSGAILTVQERKGLHKEIAVVIKGTHSQVKTAGQLLHIQVKSVKDRDRPAVLNKRNSHPQVGITAATKTPVEVEPQKEVPPELPQVQPASHQLLPPGTERNKESKQTMVRWNVNIVKTFLDACIHEITINGWENGGLKAVSWKKVGEMLKATHNFSVDHIQMINYFYGLKRKYTAWVSLKNKTPNIYNPSTNTFNLTDKEWETEIKKNKCIETLRKAPLRFPDLCAQLFDGAISTGFFQTGPSGEPQAAVPVIPPSSGSETSPLLAATEIPQEEPMVCSSLAKVPSELPQVQPASESKAVEVPPELPHVQLASALESIETKAEGPVVPVSTGDSNVVEEAMKMEPLLLSLPPQVTATQSGVESIEEPKRIRVSWENINVVKTFLDACIHEITINGQENGSLKAMSWKKVGEILKARHNFSADSKQMKNYFDGLKIKYRAWLILKSKIHNGYDLSTNMFNLTDNEWETEIKKNKCIETLRDAPLPFPDLCAQVFGSMGIGSRGLSFSQHIPETNIQKDTMSLASPSSSIIIKNKQKDSQFSSSGLPCFGFYPGLSTKCPTVPFVTQAKTAADGAFSDLTTPSSSLLGFAFASSSIPSPTIGFSAASVFSGSGLFGSTSTSSSRSSATSLFGLPYTFGSSSIFGASSTSPSIWNATTGVSSSFSTSYFGLSSPTTMNTATKTLSLPSFGVTRSSIATTAATAFGVTSLSIATTSSPFSVPSPTFGFSSSSTSRGATLFSSTSTFGTSSNFGASISTTSTVVSWPFSSGLFGSSSPNPIFTAATTTNTASKTLLFPAFGVTSSSITTTATGSVPQFANPTTTTTGTSSSFLGSKTVAATTPQSTAASSLCATGTESNKESKQNMVYWNVNIVKTFLDACIHEITINGWDGCNLTLKPMSWKKVGEMLKARHNFSVDTKQMDNYFDGLKTKYIAWVSLRNKAGNKYDPSTNMFNLTDKEWKTELMKNKCIGTLRDAPLPFPDLCAQLFYGALSAGYFQTGVDQVLTGPAFHPKKRHCKVAGGPSGEASLEVPQKEAMVEVPPELPQVQPATASVTIETKRTMSVFEEEILGVLKMIAEKMNKPEPPSKPTFEDCEKKLNQLGWRKDDPLHEVAYAIFCEENDKYRELWMKLDPKRCANWVRMIGRSKNFL
ncbi:hypothetical protein Lser_V15G33469 [Lactuca serriola]